MGKRLYVGNLSYSVTAEDLRELFGASGAVTEVKVVLDRDTGRPRGFGFVEMGDEASAGKAIAALDGRDLQGRALNVRIAEDRNSGGRGW